MILTLLSIVHVILGIILIIIVLLQTGRGQDVASAFGGGGSTTIFGITGGGSVLNKITTIAALMFMFTALGLTIMSSKTKESILKKEANEINIPQLPENQQNAPMTTTKEKTNQQEQSVTKQEENLKNQIKETTNKTNTTNTTDKNKIPKEKETGKKTENRPVSDNKVPETKGTK